MVDNDNLADIAARVASLRARVGLSQSELARRIGVSPQSIQQLEAGHIRRPRYLLRLAKLLDVSAEWLEDGAGAQVAPVARIERGTADVMTSNVAPGIVNVPAPGTLPVDVAVFGVAAGGRDGDFSFNGTVIDYVRRPPGIADARTLFAIYVIGESMVPRYGHGDLVFVHKGRPARIGDDVLVELVGDGDAAGPCFIKRLVRRTASRVVLGQFNPPRDDIVIEAKRAVRTYRILTTAELLGV